jgi:hypothetical protein
MGLEAKNYSTDGGQHQINRPTFEQQIISDPLHKVSD